MRVHVIQVAYGDDEPPAERVQRVAELVRAQRGADLVILPELWAHGGFAYRTWAAQAEPVNGPTVSAIAEAAREIGAVVHAGSIVEAAGDAPAGGRGATGRGLWNTSVLLGPDGGVLATYRKIHRFGFGQGEPTLLEAGERLVIIRLPAAVPGEPATAPAEPALPPAEPVPPPEPAVVGLATCYDLRFPELFRGLLDAGARVVLIPAAWPAARVEAWQLLGRARAIENQTVVVQCNTGGTHSGVPMGGHSQVVDAAGTVLADAGVGEEVLVVDVDLAAIDVLRAQFPVLADRRL